MKATQLKRVPSTLRDIMSRDCYRVKARTSILELAQGLTHHRLPGVPVVDDLDRLIGFISEQDILGKLLDRAYHCGQHAQVGDLMRHEVLSVGPNDSITDLAQHMNGQRPKVYPVVEQGRLIGMVTRRDVLSALLVMQNGC